MAYVTLTTNYPWPYVVFNTILNKISIRTLHT